ncbi:hypothetical protein C6I20_14400 [Aeromicrobium sp. A1-2]|nr:hypothetical protein C6I20_14400 [Aeromicrobium sp. A1-2]
MRYLELHRFDELSEVQVYHRLARALQTLIAPCDPFRGPRRKRLTFAEYEQLVNSRDIEAVERLNDVLHEIVNDLVFSSANADGGQWIAQTDGNFAFDGTLIKAGGGRGTDKKFGRYVSSEPDASIYFRDGDHSGTDISAGKKKFAKHAFGFELTLATMTDNFRVGRDGEVHQQEMPHVVVGIGWDGASRAPGRNAIRALKSVPAHGLPVNLGLGDRAYYSGAKTEHFHVFASAMGFKPVTEYRVDQLGKQDDYRGALQVDGWWYCSTMPKNLISATKDYKDGLIDKKTRNKRVEARRKYAAIRKSRPDSEGVTRWSHPVNLGHRCNPDRKDADLFCTQKTISIPLAAGLKHAQEFQFESPEWKAAYNLRTTVEQANGGLKRGSTHNLGEKEKRRLRGRTAQFVLAALVVMARNIELLRLARRKQEDVEFAKSVARKKELRKSMPYNSARMNDDEREEIEKAMAART